ncbi:MAG: AAA family ATPase [archaeon]
MIENKYIEPRDERYSIPRKKLLKDNLKGKGNVRLIGETGTGKTTLVHDIIEENEWNLFETVINRDTTKYDLLTSQVLENGNTKVKEGIVTKWIKSDGPSVLYLDGWNYASSDLLALVESLADFRGSINISDLGEKFYRDDEHYIIISMNPSTYTGTKNTNKAQIRRFTSIVFPYLQPKQEAKAIYQKSDMDEKSLCLELSYFAHNIRQSEVSQPIDLGSLINYANLIVNEKYDFNTIVELYKGSLPPRERESGKIETLYSKARKKAEETEPWEDEI